MDWGHASRDFAFYPRDHVVRFPLLGLVPLFEVRRLARPHPSVGSEMTIVPEMGGVESVRLLVIPLPRRQAESRGRGPDEPELAPVDGARVASGQKQVPSGCSPGTHSCVVCEGPRACVLSHLSFFLLNLHF